MSKGFRNFVKRTGQTALVLGMVAGAGLTAHAAKKQAVTTANLNIRVAEGTNHAIVTTIPKGETVNVLEDKGSWWKVDYKGQQGYSAKRYLVIRNNKPIKEDLRVKADVLNVRTGPSTNFKRIGQVKYGQILKATGKVDGWFEINFNGQVGYVSGDYVTVNGQSENHTSTPAKGQMKCVASSLRIRSGAGTNYRTVGYLQKGEVVSVLEKVSNGWYKIKDNNGVVGYCSGTYLESVNGGGSQGGQESAKGYVKVTATGLNVRSGAGTGYRIVGYASKGQTLEKLAVAGNGWVKVRLSNGTVGWVSGKYVTATGNPNGGTDNVKPASGQVKVTATGLNVRSGAGTEYKIVGYASKGDILTVLAKHDNGWLKVKLSNGTVGWVSGKYVVNHEIPSKPEQKPEEKPIKPGIINHVPVVKIENSVIELHVGDKWSNDMVKYIASDKETQVLTIKIENNIDTSKAGEYQVKVSATDLQGATGSAIAKVIVKEKETVPPVKPEVINHVPVITVTNNTTNINNEDLGAFFQAHDKEDGDISNRIEWFPQGDIKVGMNQILVTVTDSQGAKASKIVEMNLVAVEPTMTAENVTIKEGSKFDVSMAKPIAEDCEGTDISKDVKIVAGEVNTSKAGTYNVTLGVTDKWGLKATKEIKVVVVKGLEQVNEAPVITAKEDLVLTVGDKFENSMLNAKATDKEDGKVDVVVKGEVNTAQAGNYELTLVAKDSKGATTTKKVTVVVKEKAVTPDEAPVLTVGQKVVTITQGGKVSVADFKATAKDKEDGVITDDIKLLGSYDVNKPGTYDLELKVMDSKGNVAKEAVKLVVNMKALEMNEVPTLEIAHERLELTVGDHFDNSMLGIVANDKEDGKIDAKVDGTVNTKEAGEYKLTVTAEDSKGGKVVKHVVVVVKEAKNEAPKLNVPQTRFEITQGDAWSNDKIGATATDKEDGKNVKITYSGDVKVNEPGEYTVTVTATDSKGATDTVKVTVVVVKKEVPNQAPVVTADDISIKQGAKFNYDMLNAKATDADGDEVKITYSGTVNTSKPGKYPITVTATDSKGATASVEVIVTVNEAPVGNYDPNGSAFKSAVTSQMFSLVNQHRLANGKQNIVQDGSLNALANSWSKYMADKGFFDHVDGSGNGASEVFPGHTPTTGENIVLVQFKCTGDMQQDAVNLANMLFGMWKNSPSHNSNMLDTYSNVFGFGFHAVKVGETGTTYSIYATQEFSYDWNRPAPEAPQDEKKVEEKQEAPKEEVHEEVKQEVNHETQATPEQKPEETVKPAEPQAKPEVEAPVAPTPEPEKAPEQPKEEAPAQPEAGMSGAEMTDGPTAEMN